jgi:hypothetical protein
MVVSRVTSPALAGAVLLALVSSARADGDVVPLGAFVTQSDAIVIGVVSQVTAIGAPGGAHLARIDIQQTLKGNPGSSIVVAGNYRDPDDAMFVEGVRVLAFLQGGRPIGAAAGIVEIADDGAAKQAATIVTRALRNQRPAANFRDVFLRSGMRVPRPLLASLLEELALRLTPQDNGLLVEAACDGADAYLPAVRGWAMAQAGRRKLADVRQCLEVAAVSATDTRFAGEALDALGDLGDRRSVPALVSWINEVMRGPQRGTSRASTAALSAGVLALGKIGDASAAATLLELSQRGNDASLDSTVVHALRLIGTPGVDQALDTIGREHPNPQIRDEARTALQQLQLSRTRRNP